MKPSSSSWRNLIWREWLHTEDVQYAAQLYELVADKPPVAWPTIIVMAGLGMSLGTLLGLFLWVLVNWTVGIGSLSESFNWNVVSYYIIGVGGVTCLLFCLFTWFAFSWRYSWATFFTGVRAGLIVGILFGFIQPLLGLLAGVVTGSAWMLGWLKPKRDRDFFLRVFITLIVATFLIPFLGSATGPVALIVLIIALLYLSFGPGLALYSWMRLLLPPKRIKKVEPFLINWLVG